MEEGKRGMGMGKGLSMNRIVAADDVPDVSFQLELFHFQREDLVGNLRDQASAGLHVEQLSTFKELGTPSLTAATSTTKCCHQQKK